MDVSFYNQILRPHPTAPPHAVTSVTCSATWRNSRDWVFSFIVSRPPEALRLPEAAMPARADGLWRKTCFEVFLRRPGETAYQEFNFSPSGEWAAYSFDDYRKHRHDLDIGTLFITTSDPDQFAMASVARLESLGVDSETARLLAASTRDTPMLGPALQFGLSAMLDSNGSGEDGQWLVGLSAVIEEAEGTRSYWALAHPADKPDFHHPDSFACDIPVSRLALDLPPDPA